MLQAKADCGSTEKCAGYNISLMISRIMIQGYSEYEKVCLIIDTRTINLHLLAACSQKLCYMTYSKLKNINIGTYFKIQRCIWKPLQSSKYQLGEGKNFSSIS